MARYTGPVCKICRRAGEKLFLKGDRCATPKCTVEKRGAITRFGRRKVSEYGLQLKEKQKARHLYGVLEGQFWKLFSQAKRRPGLTGENLLQLLERRLDNVVYRLGFADSRSQARQLVFHGHILLNGRKADIPSIQVKAGDAIEWAERSKRLEIYLRAAQGIQDKVVPGWLSLDKPALSGRVLVLPPREDIDYRINEKAIVEFYSR